MVVECPHCQAELQVEEGVRLLRCDQCESEFDPAGRATVRCSGCGSRLAVPPGARVVVCGTCRQKVDVNSGGPVQRPSSHTSLGHVKGEESTSPHEETSILDEPADFQDLCLQNVRQEFADRYDVLEQVGRGGMGAVFKARQKQPERVVVLKVMLSGRFGSKKYRRRFEREAQAVARLEHPGIVSVYEYGEVNGQPYFSMEYVEGCNVREYVSRHKLDKEEICRLVMKVCRAVGYAHQRGVIHRDLKPSNILVDGQGNPRLLDFGLARLADGHWSEDPDMSEAGEVMGTPSYMSPEQTIGRPDEIDLRSDVYSIGVLFYELLTGTLPYRIDRNRPLESLRIVRDYIPKRPSAVNPKVDDELDCIVMKCIEKEREMRYQSAVELAEDINRYVSGKPVEARPSTSFYHLRKLVWRHRGLFLPTAAALLIALVLNAVVIAELVKSRRDFHVAYQQVVDEREQILEFVGDLKAVRSTVDDLILQGRWLEAYRKAVFVEQYLGSAGYQGYAEEVKQRVATQAQEELGRVKGLIDELKFRSAREQLRRLRMLADSLELPQLAESTQQLEDRFGDICGETLLEKMGQGGPSVRVLERFLAECPDSSYEDEARSMLQTLMQRIRWTEWPFDGSEARDRQRITASILEVETEHLMPLDNGARLALSLVPAGEFLMGTDAKYAGEDAGPRHRVAISTPFYLSASEVTYRQFEAVTGRLPAAARETGGSVDGSLPAVVSWREAQDFCSKLSRRSGKVVRLPTEAEWEYACRAGSDGRFTHGVGADGEDLGLVAWYGQNADGRARPVAGKAPNAWGLYDVYGNLLEWCSDWYDARYYQASPVEDPPGPETGAFRVLRGGSFQTPLEEMGTAVRRQASPDSVRPMYGFRICVEVPAPGTRPADGGSAFARTQISARDTIPR